uniref:Uncharacterized protein n=1 Tax=Amphimedon queenslandica TaxID=400682 RepID=A0A1X7VHS0_AMPQE
MEGFISKNRSNARAYYIRQCNRVKSNARIAYKISKKYKIASGKASTKQFHALNPSYILQKCKNWYSKNKDSKILKSTCYSKTNYRSNPDYKKEAARDQYHKNPQPKKEASRDQYHNNPQPKKEASRDQYHKNSQPKKEASRNHYQNNPNPKKSKSKERYHKNPGLQKQNSLKQYYENRDAILRATKDKFLRYKFSDNEMDKLKMALNKEKKRQLNKDYYDPLYYSPEIVNDLLPSSMKGVDFENTSYDNSPIAIPVDTTGMCYVAVIVQVSCIDRIEECNDDSDSEDDNFDNNRMYTNKRKPALKWHCTDRCKSLLESDVSSIIEVRRYFDESIKELKKHLDVCDNCPNTHYMRRSLHVEEIDQVHEHDFCDNPNVTYSNAIDEFKKALSDQAVNACCCCERLLRKKSVTEAKNLDSDVWNILLDLQ